MPTLLQGSRLKSAQLPKPEGERHVGKAEALHHEAGLAEFHGGAGVIVRR